VISLGFGARGSRGQKVGLMGSSFVKNLPCIVGLGVAVESGWESEDLEFEPRRVQGSKPGGYRQPLTPGCPKKITSDSQPKTVCLS